MAKTAKKNMTIRQQMDPILAYAYPEKGGVFGQNAFNRAMAAGQDPVAQQMAILEALKKADQFGVKVDPNFQWLANGGFDQMLNEYRTNTAGSPKTAINPNLQNIPLLTSLPEGYFNAYLNDQSRFPASEGMKRGFGLSGGYGNVQDQMNEGYWQTQIDSNPEVNYRWNTGDSLDPGRDANNSYGRLAEADLNGTSQSPEMVALARARANAYEKGTPMDNWTGSVYLHEKDPRYAAVNAGGKDALNYMYQLDPNRGSSDAYKRLNAALNEGALDVMPQNSAQGTAAGSTTGATAATGGLAGKSKMDAIKNAEKFGQALKIAASGDSLLGAKESMAIRRKFGKSADQQVGRLDKINLKQAANKGPIGLTSNFTNKYMAGKLKNPPMYSFGDYNKPKGGLAQALAGMKDTTTPWIKGQGGYTTPGFGKTPKGFGVMGFGAGKPIYQTAKSLGGWNYSPKPKTDTTEAVNTNNTGITNPITPQGGGFGGGSSGDSGSLTTPAGPGSTLGGGTGGPGALGIKSPKSSWKLSGRNTKGPTALRNRLSTSSINFR